MDTLQNSAFVGVRVILS